MNWAEVMVPADKAGRGTSPEWLRALSVSIFTVPLLDPATIFPKERSEVLLIFMGATMVAVAFAVAEALGDWARIWCAAKAIIKKQVNKKINFFIILFFTVRQSLFLQKRYLFTPFFNYNISRYKIPTIIAEIYV
jgi:hypothetical protein